jgi:hypothetical protein
MCLFDANVSSVDISTHGDSDVSDVVAVGSSVPTLNLISLIAIKTGSFVHTLPIVRLPLDRDLGIDLG